MVSEEALKILRKIIVRKMNLLVRSTYTKPSRPSTHARTLAHVLAHIRTHISISTHAPLRPYAFGFNKRMVFLFAMGSP